MRTSNVVFNKIQEFNCNGYENATMTGVGIKSGILLLACLISACLSIIFFKTVSIQMFLIYGLAIIATVVFQIIITFNPRLSKSLSIPYVICEGITIGVICDLLEYALPKEGFALATGALIITLGIVLASCILYSHAGLRAKPGFIKFFIIMVFGISIASIFFAITSLILVLTTGISLWAIYISSSLSVLVSVLMVIISSIYVFLTIQRANEIVESGIDKEYEWYASFGIAISVIWLFLEVLKLLIRIAARRRD